MKSDQFLEANIPQYALWWLLSFHQRSSCSIAPCWSMLFHALRSSTYSDFVFSMPSAWGLYY